MRGKKGVMVMALFPAHFSTYLVPLNTIRLVFNRCLFPPQKKLKERKKNGQQQKIISKMQYTMLTAELLDGWLGFIQKNTKDALVF